MKWNTILITGASSGLGAVMAETFASQGIRVYAVGRNKANLQALAETAPEHLIPVVLDVRDAEAVKETVAKIEAEHPIEVLINNAAIYQRSPFVDQDLEKARQILDTNILGTLYPTHAVLPGMIARKAGHIVQINSVAGTRGIPDESIYCASKHAITGFSESLMQELQPHNVRVSVIHPGGIETPLWDRDGNFYPGDRSRLLDPKKITELVEYLLNAPDNMMFKKLVFFPDGEWH